MAWQPREGTSSEVRPPQQLPPLTFSRVEPSLAPLNSQVSSSLVQSRSSVVGLAASVLGPCSVGLVLPRMIHMLT